jgi:hypothetical protein
VQCEESGSALYGRACRSLAESAVVDEVADRSDWDVPLRLLGGVHYLALADGVDPWDDVVAFVAERREWLRRFVSEQAVQTNEVQRCWALLPAFLTLSQLSGLPLDLVELGPSAGLNLLWDRYGYRYASGAWGDLGGVVLAGEERRQVPASLLSAACVVGRRVGIDMQPVDVTTEHGSRLLEAFVWADQHERRRRLRAAIEVVRADPPELIRGDYVDALPLILAGRRKDALTVVFQTASTGYLPDDRYASLREVLVTARGDQPLGWISTRRLEERETEAPHC